MNDLAVIALGKAISEDAYKAASAKLDAGDYPVDVTVHVKGVVRKGDDYPQKFVAKADPWLLLAAALSHLNGVTVDSIVREALTADPALVESLKKQAADAIQDIKEPTLSTANGKVTAKLVAEIVGE